MMSAVAGPEESNGRPSAEALEEGVLSNLPRARPQRATERRIAARKAAGKRTKAAPRGATRKPARATSSDATAGATAAAEAGGAQERAAGAASAPGAKRTRRTQTAGKTRSRTGAARPRKPVQEPAPRQGFESEGERVTGPVQPPGGAEIVASAAEIVGEIAKAGLSAGERVLRDVLSRLPLT
jgi:hypothetical protein